MKKDQRVSFTRQHDRAHTLTGTVVEVKGEEVLIATEPDGAHVWANLADVTPVAEEKETKAPTSIKDHKKSA